jgi:hypothetical protein
MLGTVSEQPPHLSADEVARVLELVRDADAVVVGGQSMAIWARHYSDYNSEIAKIYTMSSEDVDFYGSRKAAENFAAKLGNAKILIPDLDDHGPNSAQVIGLIGNREIRVDFLHSILGVDATSIKNNVITLTGERSDNGETLAIAVLHPLDCYRSRLSNINDLKRTNVHSISSVFEKYLTDERLDSRWRSFQLTASLNALNAKVSQVEAAVKSSESGA